MRLVFLQNCSYKKKSCINILFTYAWFSCKSNFNVCFLNKFTSLTSEKFLISTWYLRIYSFCLFLNINSPHISLILVVTRNFHLGVKFHQGVQHLGQNRHKMSFISSITCNQWEKSDQRPKSAPELLSPMGKILRLTCQKHWSSCSNISQWSYF